MFSAEFQLAGFRRSRAVAGRCVAAELGVIAATVLVIPGFAAPVSSADDEDCSSRRDFSLSFSCTVPTGMTKIKIAAVGGGGAGGNGGGAWEDSGGTGYRGGDGGNGGSGAFVTCVAPVKAGQVVTATAGDPGEASEKVGFGTESAGTASAGDNGGDGGNSVINIDGVDVAFASGGYGGEGGGAASRGRAGRDGVHGIGGPESLSFCSGDFAKVVAGEAGDSFVPPRPALSKASGTYCDGKGAGGLGGEGGLPRGEEPTTVDGEQGEPPKIDSGFKVVGYGCAEFSFGS